MNSPTILLVEDDSLLAESIIQSLIHEGLFVCGVAKNFKEAVELMKANDIDIALIDMQLDGPEDGIATASELHKIKWIPIIYMTGTVPLELKQRMMDTFPSAFLEKPIRPRELYVQINLALNNFHSGQISSALSQKSDQIFLPADHGFIGVKIEEILFIKAERVNAQLYLSKSEFTKLYPTRSYGPILISAPKGSIAPKLPPNFYALSRSFIINLEHLYKIDSTRLFIQNHEISIPEGKRKSLLNQLLLIKNH